MELVEAVQARLLGILIGAAGYGRFEAAADKHSNFLVKFECSGEGQTWTRNYWMSLQLLMQETEREP